MPIELIGILGVAFTFGVAIFVHEFGHFIFAKLTGVPVATFSFGFGKKIVKYRWGETVYAIGIIPFGGYVQLGKPADEVKAKEETEIAEKPTPEETDDSAEEATSKKKSPTEGIMEDLATLENIPYLAKILIFSAGVGFNFLTAIAVLTLLYTIGFQIDAPWDARIGDITHPYVREKIGLQQGDTIVAVEGNTVENWFDFEAFVRQHSVTQPDKPLFLTVKRDGERFGLKVPLYLDDNKTSPILAYIRPHIPAYVGRIIPNQPAEKAGLKNGDLILAINGKEVKNWFEMASIIRRNPGKPLRFTIKRNDQMLNLVVTPRANPEHPEFGQIGIIMGNPKKIIEQKPFPESLLHSFTLSYYMLKFVVTATYDLIKNASFSVVRENIAGPVGIAILSYQAAQSGWAEFFNFFAILNLLLFLFNLIPLPVLDGGHILIVTIEAITRRRIPPKILVRVFSVMLVFLIAFAVWVTLNDILMNLWRLGFGK